MLYQSGKYFTLLNVQNWCKVFNKWFSHRKTHTCIYKTRVSLCKAAFFLVTKTEAFLKDILGH